MHYSSNYMHVLFSVYNLDTKHWTPSAKILFELNTNMSMFTYIKRDCQLWPYNYRICWFSFRVFLHFLQYFILHNIYIC